MLKARIENGVVREILSAEPFPDFHPDLVWVECGEDVREGWIFDGVFSAPQVIPLEPTTAEKIRALEAQYTDAQAKMTRQALLVIALDKACADPLAAGMTREQVHATLMTADNGYSALFKLEQYVSALRAQL